MTSFVTQITTLDDLANAIDRHQMNGSAVRTEIDLLLKQGRIEKNPVLDAYVRSIQEQSNPVYLASRLRDLYRK